MRMHVHLGERVRECARTCPMPEIPRQIRLRRLLALPTPDPNVFTCATHLLPGTRRTRVFVRLRPMPGERERERERGWIYSFSEGRDLAALPSNRPPVGNLFRSLAYRGPNWKWGKCRAANGQRHSREFRISCDGGATEVHAGPLKGPSDGPQ
jgi:hypothetical protein